METILAGLVLTFISAWLASIEWRMRAMDEKLRQVPSRREVMHSIDIKQESLKVMQVEIKEDIKEIKRLLQSKN